MLATVLDLVFLSAQAFLPSLVHAQKASEDHTQSVLRARLSNRRTGLNDKNHPPEPPGENSWCLGSERPQGCGRKRNAKQDPTGIHLVLLGDILDVLRSAKWCDGAVRPWDSPQNPQFKERVEAITKAIIDNNAESVEVLRTLSKEGTVKVPKTMKSGAASSVDFEEAGDEWQPVQVDVHYQVGNHDWFYHLPGAEFDPLREHLTLQRHFPLAPAAEIP